MALRFSSQAHPAWKDAANQIKTLITKVDKTLGDSLINICELNQRCVWHSKMDRPCQDCIGKPWIQKPNHIHDFSKGKQCSCGEMESSRR